jgi:hypothetical protein
VAPQIAVEKTDVERIEEGSDEESEEEEKRTWKISRVEMENMRKVLFLSSPPPHSLQLFPPLLFPPQSSNNP